MKILDELVRKVKTFIGGENKESSSSETPRPEPHVDPTEPGYGSMRVPPESEEPEGEVHATLTPITDHPDLDAEDEDPFDESRER